MSQLEALNTFFSGSSAACDVGTTVVTGVVPLIQSKMPPVTREQFLEQIRDFIDNTIAILDAVRPIVEESGTSAHVAKFGECERDCDEAQKDYHDLLQQHHKSWSFRKYFDWKDKLRVNLEQLHTEVKNLKRTTYSVSQRIRFDVARTKSPRVQAHLETIAATSGTTDSAIAVISNQSSISEAIEEASNQSYTLATTNSRSVIEPSDEAGQSEPDDHGSTFDVMATFPYRNEWNSSCTTIRWPQYS